MRASTRTSKKPAHRAGGVGDAVPRVLGAAQNLGAGAIHLPRAGPIPLAPSTPGKLCFPGDPLPPGLENPRLHRGFGWRQRVRAPPTHRLGPASAGRRGTPSQAFWGNAPKPWRRADSFRPSMPNKPQVTKKEDVLPDVLFLERVTRLELPPRPQESYAFLGTPTSWIGKSTATPRIWVEVTSSSLFRCGKRKASVRSNRGFYVERVTRLELATSTLARWRSTR